ncbi:hypothetical protein PIROE2DRAFT_19210 [Piromyces sp. E2]|nr:hypothetical protein PIROE2DRAFT_19210 [Piromyces sp. E2]|eukprot:OUM56255.1 hypothetical protein PIROE2DRAFT_19210 [Piromyces sp. E2]
MLNNYFNNLSANINNNNNSENSEENKNNNKKLTEIIYITIQSASTVGNIEDGFISESRNNENFEFNGFKLKDIYDKIINNFSPTCCRFIDKPKMIKRLIDNNSQVNKAYLITRPRRFGKSLNLKMIRNFFEKTNDNDNNKKKKLFDGLEITDNERYIKEFQKYPVIYLNFGECEADDYESAIEFLKFIISEAYIYHEKSETTLLHSLIFLCECLKKSYERKCIILIDEYDKTLINSLIYRYFEKVLPKFKNLYSVCKNNENLYFGILTGCFSFKIKNLFSGVNDIYECSLLHDNCFSDCYGFDEEEVNHIFSYLNIPDEVKNKVKIKI